MFTDEQWERIERLLPTNVGRQGHPFGDNRGVVEGIAYRYRAGIFVAESAAGGVRAVADGLETAPPLRR